VRELDEALAEARRATDKQVAVDALVTVLQRHRDNLSRAIGRSDGA
jgi:hypothetical protein